MVEHLKVLSLTVEPAYASLAEVFELLAPILPLFTHPPQSPEVFTYFDGGLNSREFGRLTLPGLPGLWLRKDFLSDNLIFDNAYIIYVIMLLNFLK